MVPRLITFVVVDGVCLSALNMMPHRVEYAKISTKFSILIIVGFYYLSAEEIRFSYIRFLKCDVSVFGSLRPSH
jgi:hypothetical protein